MPEKVSPRLRYIWLFTRTLNSHTVILAMRSWIFALLLFCLSSASSEPMEKWPDIIGNYCLDCHDHQSEKGDLNLEDLLDAEINLHAGAWERVVRQLEARQMPPRGEDLPSPPEYEIAIAELIDRLDQHASDHPDPGRTDTLRRLTRQEYQNAIRDLLDLEIDAAHWLPADESSHGFDNITVGDMPPELLERYLTAARSISRMAVGMPRTTPDGRTVRLPPDLTQEHHVEGLPLGTRGGANIRHLFPRSGQYEIQLRLTRDRNEKIEGLQGRHEIVVLLDQVEKDRIPLLPPRNQKDHSTYDSNLKATVAVPAGTHHLGVTFIGQSIPAKETLRQPYVSQFNYHRHPRQAPAIYEISIFGPLTDDGIEETESRQRIFAVHPGELGEEAAARINLSRLMRLAYRRPVDDDDIERVMSLFRAGRNESGTFDGGMEAALSAILVSRDFIFKVENDPPGIEPGSPYRIGDRELASRLSFFLWSSLPDEELLSLVESGSLNDPTNLKTQALRMLADPRSRSLVTNFASQWLYLRNLEAVTPDARRFPDFDHNLREAFRLETELLFGDVVRSDRSVLDLIRSDETHLNERLARHYGIPHIRGSRFRKVALEPGSRRGGLLRHGSILAITSYANRTSPVIRGNWILENLLGTPPPPPPPDVPALEDNSVSGDLPIRQRLAAHREQAACASCHNVIDPIGFALENYDAVGRWRTLENGAEVDALGGLPDGSEFEGVEGLEEAILKRPELLVRTLTEKLLTFALGRGNTPSDAAAIRKIVKDSRQANYSFSSVITGIVTSDPFTMRTSESN